MGRTVTAVGTLKLKSPGSRLSGFAVDNASIVVTGTPLSLVQRQFLALDQLADMVRLKFEENLVSSYSAREAALIAGMLLGVKEQFSATFFRKLQQSGLLHLVAASGYNISIMIGAAGGLTILLIRNRLINIITAIFFITVYIIIAGAGASVVRAGIMGTLGFLALQVGSTKSAKRIFILVAILMLLIKPSWLWNLGFQLSVAATTGLLWIEPVLKRKIWGGYGGRVREPAVVLELTASLAASLATLPVLITWLGWERVSWAGILVNVPAGLLVAPIMIVGAAVGLLGLVWPGAAQAVAILGRPVAWGMIKLIEFGAWLNGMVFQL